ACRHAAPVGYVSYCTSPTSNSSASSEIFCVVSSKIPGMGSPGMRAHVTDRHRTVTTTLLVGATCDSMVRPSKPVSAFMSPDVMLRRWLLWLLFVAVAWGTLFVLPTQLNAATILIPKGAGWRFLDDGSNQGTDWKEISYNDDAWGFGHAELGFGDAVDGRPEVTQLRPGIDPDTPTITFYFRRFFYVADVASYTNAFVGLLRDDGGVVYINGVEVFRSGMPDGPIDFE